jgi:hypothetical protein
MVRWLFTRSHLPPPDAVPDASLCAQIYWDRWVVRGSALFLGGWVRLISFLYYDGQAEATRAVGFVGYIDL